MTLLGGDIVKIIDCRGFTCPKPVILTKNELEKMEDEILEVIVDNETAKENVSKFAQNSGCEYQTEQKDEFYYIKIRKKESFSASSVNLEKQNGPVILVSTDKFGTGDDNLGAALMKSYIFALSESDVKPEVMLFANGGVKLTCEDSDVLESLKSLQENGVEMLSCGTCLDFYKLKEKLSIGNVTNMYTIVEKMNKSFNTIKI